MARVVGGGDSARFSISVILSHKKEEELSQCVIDFMDPPLDARVSPSSFLRSGKPRNGFEIEVTVRGVLRPSDSQSQKDVLELAMNLAEHLCDRLSALTSLFYLNRQYDLQPNNYELPTLEE